MLRSTKAAGLVSALALSLGAVALPSAHAATDHTAAGDVASWMSAQLTNGLVHNDQYNFDDYGLSLDFANALQGLGKTAEAKSIVDALAPNIDYYVSYASGANYDHTHLLAGSMAKAAVAVQQSGEDATSYGGRNLVADVEARVLGTSVVDGRIADQYTPSDRYEADFANTIGQAFAARALTTAGSAKAPAVTSFLLSQQCSAGYFTASFNSDPTAAAQSCDARTADPSPDTTALAVLQMQAITGNADVTAAVTKATDWLIGQQKADGSWGGSGTESASNTNNTGLSSWALMGTPSGAAAATNGAAWLRGRQVRDAGACTTKLTPNQGALAYDDAAMTQGLSDGIPAVDQDQWRRATAQAAPALTIAPLSTGDLTLTGSSGYLQARTSTRLSVAGIAPVSKGCLNGGGSHQGWTADSSGASTRTVTLPGGTANRTYAVMDSEGRRATKVLKVLGARTIRIAKSASSVKKYRSVRISVSGLAPNERLRVLFKGVRIRDTHVSANGYYATTFRVGGSLGLKTISVLGQFASIRHGSTSVRVVR